MPTTYRISLVLFVFILATRTTPLIQAAEPERIGYNHPGLVVDLGVGLWADPLPIDYDDDGDMDLLVSCHDKPSNGVYFFENAEGNVPFPVFRPAVRLFGAVSNITISYTPAGPQVFTAGKRHPEFLERGVNSGVPVELPKPVHAAGGRIRANQWKEVDFDDDGKLDLLIGGGDWSDYGWDNAFDARGRWTHGPLHGYVYVVRNKGTSENPSYGTPEQLEAGKAAIDVFGMPSPNLADFDGDGDLDLLCGEFIDRLTYFENVGGRSTPRYAPGRFLTHDGDVMRMELCMIVPVAIDWDRDGDVDLVVGQEDGRVALIENTGDIADGVPVFAPPRFFRQQADKVKVGALVTPSSCDWDGDGDEDLICGDTAGFIEFVENLDGGETPRWAAPVRLSAGGEVIRIEAGENGSIQGPCEAKWGYTVPYVVDWDQDGRLDILANSIWGKVIWFKNAGTRTSPELAAAQPIEVAWTGTPPKPAWNWWDPEGSELATQWRTTPAAADINGDGLVDLVMLDHEGYLALYPRRREQGRLTLAPPERVFYDDDGKPLRLNAGTAGKSGRRKFTLVDWDGDGRTDILINSKPNVDFLRNVGPQTGHKWVFANQGPVAKRVLAGHTTCPTTVDWNKDQVPDLLIGAEDGYLYYLPNER